jgi:hypothetical protein
MFWFAFAAQLSLPMTANALDGNVAKVFTANDYPAFLKKSDKPRTVQTRTTVRPDGTVQSCVAEVGSGDARLDAYTCDLIVRRSHFLPAKWTDGSPVYGVIRLPVTWMSWPPRPGTRMKSNVDLAFGVNRLPDGVRSPAGVGIVVATDENGRVLSCAKRTDLPLNPEGIKLSELFPLACEQAIKSLSVQPAVDAGGKPVRSVQNASVQFIADH